MSRSRGKLHLARACPWCATLTLERDYYTNHRNQAHSVVSYICTNCCTGFSIKDSPRAAFVNQMYARERKQRPAEGKGGGQLPLQERTLDELKSIEALLAEKRPHGQANRVRVEASLLAVREAIMNKEGTQPAIAVPASADATAL